MRKPSLFCPDCRKDKNRLSKEEAKWMIENDIKKVEQTIIKIKENKICKEHLVKKKEILTQYENILDKLCSIREEKFKS